MEKRCGARLNLFAEAGDGDAEHFAVLGHGAASDAVAFVVEDVHQLLVGKWMAFILLGNTLLEDIFNLVARYLLARYGLHSLGEE